MNEPQIQVIPEFDPATSAGPQQELSELAETLNKIFRDYRIAMYEFNDAMKRRDEIAKRAHKRAKLWTLLGVTSLLLVIGVLFFLVLTLSANFKFMSEQLSSLSRNITTSSVEMGNLKQNLAEVKNQFSQLGEGTSPVAAKAISNVNDKMKQVQTSIDQLGTSLHSVQDNIDAMRNSMTKMNKRITNLSQSMEEDYSPRYGFPRRY